MPSTFQRLITELLRSFMRKFVVVYFDDILIYSRGVSADPDKVRVIISWPRPPNVHDTRSFIGLATFYRHFVQNFSSVTAPIIDCLKMDPFQWTEAADQAFERVKALMTQAPVLRVLDFNKVFEVTCDASDIGIGGVLSQDGHP
ncbi:unnamed protein product [Spirodela intermedia]|uniref:Reverse transcriptase/retrotransposon-derived protein RNase H-like domain-containing protein n=1 Tax=Spirodela intermedia TaxID=51605 RepID=A0A7I8JGN3_SPIIN|nr:unnamed protein product [Spirodela intermedia]CAA6668925.1 unnamed protein product [Spirodela intermedia]